MKNRQFVICRHGGNTFDNEEDYEGLALTIEVKDREEAKAILAAIMSDQST